MPTLPVTPQLIAQIVPSQTLADISVDSQDTQNDLELLLHWLRCAQTPAVESEPLPRVKAAARLCLRNQSQQTEFVKLWLNSVRASLPAQPDLLLDQILRQISELRLFYSRQASYLNLGRKPLEIFQRGTNAVFSSWLARPEILAQLETLISDAPFDSGSLALNTVPAIGMTDTLRGIVIRSTIRRISSWVRENCSGKWDSPRIDALEEWVRLDLFPSFSAGCLSDSVASPTSNDLVRIAKDELVLLRITEIYDIVCNFPSTMAALRELNACLSQDLYQESPLLPAAQLRSKIVSVFIDLCEQRLLHLGSNTISVIIAYTKTIKSFLVIDPTGVLLDKVDRPIRSYLRTRPDFVQLVVHGMLDTDELVNPLFELAHEIELNRPPISAPIDDLTDLNWNPDPIDALPDFKRGQVSDIIDALVSIAGLRAVFIDHFTSLFADRLLRWHEYDLTHVLRQVQLLKTRFGAGEFFNLDVMIRDIQQSDMLNAPLHKTGIKLTVLSQMYWPSLSNSIDDKTFDVPVEPHFQKYGQGYADLRKGRGLKLIPSLGTVTLELECSQGVRTFTVSPMEATVMHFFNDRSDYVSEEAVVEATKIPSYDANRALRYWVEAQVLETKNGMYKAIE